ncbi:MFS general substrate transporter [Viridothelium virens]|uniref:MFS general substrate transporter n=1 Tax=Viridothelium virens TaxID=1048519 RepID=A0A6A6H1D3_VIRVR|nr:MFS general substrate transporter [Viridothelium virens]
MGSETQGLTVKPAEKRPRGAMTVTTLTKDKGSSQQVPEEGKPDEEQPVQHITSSHEHQSQNAPISKSNAILLVLTLCGAAFLNTLSVQAVVIVLPTISSDLSIPLARQQWIVSSYSLTFGCFLLLWGRLADVYGKRLIFIWGSVWVTIITIIIPFAPNEIAFDIFRGLQGLGAAANVPTAIGILGVTFRVGKSRNYAFSFYAAGVPTGAVVGNLLGGFVGQFAGWKWIFWILAVFAAIVTAAASFLIPRPSTVSPEANAKGAVDWIGGTLITVGLLALLFALTEGNIVGWSTPWIPTLIVISLVIVAIFVLWQRYLEKHCSPATSAGTLLVGRPLIKVSVFKNHRFAAAMLIMALFYSAFNNYLIYTTYYFQSYLHLSPLETTLRFIPAGATGIPIVILTAYILSLVPGTTLLLFSTLGVAIANALFASNPGPARGLSGVQTYWAFGFPAMCLSAAGADTLQPVLMLFTAQSLPQEDQALGGAMINAVREVGRAIWLAVATALQTAVERKARAEGVSVVGTYHGIELDEAFWRGLRTAGWFSVGLALVAMGVVAGAFRGVGTSGGRKR